MIHKIKMHFSPEGIVLLLMLSLIAIGTLLLALPAARHAQIPLIDLLFTTTSASCVTGLLTIPLEQFTFFGQCIILTLIQIGGIGLISMSLFLLTTFIDMGSTTQIMAEHLLNVDSHKNIKKILGIIISTTLAIEIVGALLIFTTRTVMHIKNPLFTSIFHAVSSFCGAGLTLFPSHVMQDSPILISSLLLAFIGSLGFTPLYELFHYTRHAVQLKKYKFSLHSKIVLYGSIALIATTILLFILFERNNVLNDLGFLESWTLAIYNVLSFTGSGFHLNNMMHLRNHTKFLALIISCIGSSPLSTNGGIKITSFVLFYLIVKASILGNDSIEVQGRHIPIKQTYRAATVIILSLLWIAGTTVCLLITETHSAFSDIVFESITAFTNLGISMGITQKLSMLGKTLVMISMIIGRISSIAFILALKPHSFKKKQIFK